MEHEKDGRGSGAERKDSARHISMELTADEARVTNLSLKGSRLILTIEAELAGSQLITEAEADTPPIADDPPEEAPKPASRPRAFPRPEQSHAPSAPEAASPADALPADVAPDVEFNPGGFADEEDVMGRLSVAPSRATGDSGPARPDKAAPAIQMIPEPVSPPAPRNPDRPPQQDPRSPFNREIFANSISLAGNGAPSPMDAPGFAPPPAHEPRRESPLQPPRAPLDVKPQAAPEAAPAVFDPGFAPQERPNRVLDSALSQTTSTMDSGIDDSFASLGFSPAFQDETAHPQSGAAREQPKAADILFAGAGNDDAWLLRDEPAAAVPPARPAQESQGRSPSGQAASRTEPPSAEKEGALNFWDALPESTPADAPGAGVMKPDADARAPATGDLLDGEGRNAPASDKAILPRSMGDWCNDVPRHSGDSGTSASNPETETWDASSLSLDAFPAVSEESNTVGGERHGEPQPAISFGVSSEPPAAPPSQKPDAAAPLPSARERANQPPPAPAPMPAPADDKPAIEPGGTTVLIRYTCPKCKTQGMQAVDKVGTVVNCSNCGKAMRLVMKK